MTMNPEYSMSEKILFVVTVAVIGFRPLLHELTPTILEALRDAWALLSGFWPVNGSMPDNAGEAGIVPANATLAVVQDQEPGK